MSDQAIKLVIAGVLLLHGLGHGGALGALYARSRGMDTGGWQAAHSWLLSLSTPAAITLASTFWALSLIGFVAAAMSFWGILVPAEAWRLLAIASAIVSTVGIVLFLGNWPAFNTLAALGVNLAVLVALLWLNWPPRAMFGT